MSRFLQNLASRARGAIPRLEPRRPAPYEDIRTRPTAALDVSALEPESGARPMPPWSDPSIASTSEAPTDSFLAAPPQPASATTATTSPNVNTPAPVSPARSAPATPARRTTSHPHPGAAPAADPAPGSGLPRSQSDVRPQPTVPPLEGLGLAASLPEAPIESSMRPHWSSPGASGSQHQGPEITRHSTSQTPPFTEHPARRADLPAPPVLEPEPASRRESLAQSASSEAEVAAASVAPVPVLPKESRAPRHAEAEAPQPTPPTHQPQIDVYIGTIEILAEPSVPQQPARTAAPPAPDLLSLDEFLDGKAR